MKLTDYIIDFLIKQGISHVFGVTGGAVVHLFDSAHRSGRLQPVFTHHEQTAAFAAQAYARIKNHPGACFVTTGPGGTNALTGVAAAWQDSIPCIYISGQTRFSHTTRGKTIRQLGPQQLDILSMVDPITKYAVMVDDPRKIKYYLQQAFWQATSGRPGPVWIDLPLDFQWAVVEPGQLDGFDPPLPQEDLQWEKDLQTCREALAQARRPLILAGYGIRLAHAEDVFRQLIDGLGVPFVSTWNASDLLETAHPNYMGRLGMAGQRGANLAVQNCDFLLCLGSHLAIPLTGTMFSAFAREAKIVMVDIDVHELQKKTVRVDLPICCDVKWFVEALLKRLESHSVCISDWQQKCRHYKKYNQILQEWYGQESLVNPYVFLDMLSDQLHSDDMVVIDGGGTITQMTFQTLRIKQGQRVFIDAGLCAMGSGLPQSIGACFAKNKGRTICLCGDGSFQFNIQELETLVHHGLPVKIFIINNNGYLSIRHTQGGFLEGRFVGSDKEGGMSVPNLLKVAQAYGVQVFQAAHHRELKEKIQRTLTQKGPCLCEILVNPRQEVIPRQGFDPRLDGTFAARPLEDMYPFLDRKEFLDNMIIKEYLKKS